MYIRSATSRIATSWLIGVLLCIFLIRIILTGYGEEGLSWLLLMNLVLIIATISTVVYIQIKRYMRIEIQPKQLIIKIGKKGSFQISSEDEIALLDVSPYYDFSSYNLVILQENDLLWISNHIYHSITSLQYVAKEIASVTKLSLLENTISYHLVEEMYPTQFQYPNLPLVIDRIKLGKKIENQSKL